MDLLDEVTKMGCDYSFSNVYGLVSLTILMKKRGLMKRQMS